MRGRSSFLYVDIWFASTKREIIGKSSSLEMLVALLLIFVVDTKITFAYNFVAPLMYLLQHLVWFQHISSYFDGNAAKRSQFCTFYLITIEKGMQFPFFISVKT